MEEKILRTKVKRPEFFLGIHMVTSSNAFADPGFLGKRQPITGPNFTENYLKEKQIGT